MRTIPPHGSESYLNSAWGAAAVYVAVALAALATVAYLAMSWRIKRGGK